VQQWLSATESFKLREEEAHGIVEPIGRMVRAMRRQKNVFQFVKGMCFGQRLFVENVQRCSLDLAFRERLDHCWLVNYRAAADVDDYRAWLHGGEFRFTDQSARLVV